MAGIQLVVELDDKGTPKLRQLDDVLEELGQSTAKTANKWSSSFKKMGGAVAGLVGKVRSFATSIPALLGAAGLAGTFALIVKRGFEFTSQLEDIETSLGVMVGDTTRARNMMKELVDFAARTPFALREVAEAAKLLEGAGIGGTDMLRRVGDAAAFAQVPISEMAGQLQRIAGGSFGEPFQRLAQLAVATRPMLEAEGLTFDKSGAYVGSVDAAIEAVSRIIDRRFPGMMDKLSQTWTGKISTLNDNMGSAFGNFVGPLFERMKVRVDQLIVAFGKLTTSPAIRGLGTIMARNIDKVVGALTRLLENPERLAVGLVRVAQWVEAIPRAVWGAFRAVWAGLKWIWDLFSAFVVWVPIAFQKMALDVEIKIRELFRQDIPAAMKFAQNVAGGLYDFMTSGLKAAFSAPGMLASWNESWGKIQDDLRAPVVVGVRASGGPQLQGPGLDMPKIEIPTSFQDPGFIGPPAPTITPEMLAAQRAWADAENERVAAARAGRDQLDQIWADYWAQQDQLAMNWLSDSVTAAILEKGQNLKEQLDQIWQSMKQSFVRNTIDMGIAWIRSKVSMQSADQKFGKKEIAARALYAAATVAAAKAEGSASAADAAAKYHAAHAFIPFAGAGIASGFIAKMQADIQTAGKASMFRAGTSYVSGPTGAGDVVQAYLEPGEAVIPASRVRQYGPAFFDQVRAGTLGQGGGEVFAPQFVINGASDARATMRKIRDELLPDLERLYRQRRLELGA